MPATLVSEIQPFKYGSDLSHKSAKSKNANVPRFYSLYDLAEIWHSGRGPLWP